MKDERIEKSFLIEQMVRTLDYGYVSTPTGILNIAEIVGLILYYIKWMNKYDSLDWLKSFRRKKLILIFFHKSTVYE